MYSNVFNFNQDVRSLYYTAYYYVFVLCVVPLVHEPVPSVTLKFLRMLPTISDPTAECSYYVAELNYFNKTNYPSLITYPSERTSSQNSNLPAVIMQFTAAQRRISAEIEFRQSS